MSYLNSYKRTPQPAVSYRDTHKDTPVEQYDLNWAHGDIPKLHTNKVELRVIIPSLHAEGFTSGCQDPVIKKQDLFNLHDTGDVLHFLEGMVRKDPNTILFGIFVRPDLIPQAPKWSIIPDDPTTVNPTWVFSGWVSIFNTSSYSLIAEFGISLFAHARGRGISKPASALIVKWTMDEKVKGGLGFRKFIYGANSENKASQALAGSLGVKPEGMLRSNGLAGRVTTGRGGREEDGRWPNASLDQWVGGITVEDWESGGRQKIEGILDEW